MSAPPTPVLQEPHVWTMSMASTVAVLPALTVSSALIPSTSVTRAPVRTQPRVYRSSMDSCVTVRSALRATGVKLSSAGVVRRQESASMEVSTGFYYPLEVRRGEYWGWEYYCCNISLLSRYENYCIIIA